MKHLERENKMVEKYDWSFTRENLRNRMVVELRDGSRAMVVDGVLLRNNDWIDLGFYTRLPLRNPYSHDTDIVKIFKPILSLDLSTAGELIWEDKPVYQVTMAEVEEKFGGKVDIISDGD